MFRAQAEQRSQHRRREARLGFSLIHHLKTINDLIELAFAPKKPELLSKVGKGIVDHPEILAVLNHYFAFVQQCSILNPIRAARQAEKPNAEIILWAMGVKVVGPDRFELSTYGLRVRCSTN